MHYYPNRRGIRLSEYVGTYRGLGALDLRPDIVSKSEVSLRVINIASDL